MTKNDLIYYRKTSFIKRVFTIFKPGTILFFLVLFLYAFINNGNQRIITITISICFLFVIVIYSIIINIYFLNLIEIYEETGTIKISLLKYNNIFKVLETNISEIEINIIEKTGVYRTFQLEIVYKNTLVIKQKTIGGWTKEQFKNIVTQINILKGKKSYLDFVRK